MGLDFSILLTNLLVFLPTSSSKMDLIPGINCNNGKLLKKL